MGVYQHARTSENDPMLSIAVDASSSTDSLSELDYESQLFSEKQPKPKHPARTRTRTRTLQWSAFLTCCVITVVLVVLILQYPTPPSSNDSSEGHNEATPSIQGGGLVNSTELDLKTNFLISNVPTTRSYTFDITQGFAAPDGFRKSMLLINGHSPGPLIEANTGDRIRVVVNNQLANQSTTMHWHGIDQENSVWMDGVQGVTQCGIPPGQSFTYDFTVSDQRGTFWYHSHSEVQYTDGLYGPMIIHDPDEMIPPVDDEKILMLGDVYHRHGAELLADFKSASSPWSPETPGIDPQPDNLLINGRHTYDGSIRSTTFPSDWPEETTECTGGSLHTTWVRLDERIRLRLINSGSLAAYHFSIDNHPLEIVELDGVEIEPIPASSVYLDVGQRASVIVAASQEPGNYAMRATMAKHCFVPHSYQSAGLESISYEARGIFTYEGTDVHDQLLGGPWGGGGEDEDEEEDEEKEVGELDDVRATKRHSPGMHMSHDQDQKLDLTVGDCNDLPFDWPKPIRKRVAYHVGEGNMHHLQFEWRKTGDVMRSFINETSYHPLTDDAMIWKQSSDETALAQQSQSGPGLQQRHVETEQYSFVSNDVTEGAQMVINSKDMMAHPWHLHGQNFQVVGWGAGEFGTGSTTWNLDNPMRRDTVTVPGMSHVIIRWKAENPGIWPLHCHISWHAEGGMFTTVAQRLDQLDEMLETMDEEVRKTNQGFCQDAGRHQS